MLIKHSVKLFEIMEHRLRKLRIDHFSSINSTDPYLIKSNSFSSVYWGGSGVVVVAWGRCGKLNCVCTDPCRRWRLVGGRRAVFDPT